MTGYYRTLGMSNQEDAALLQCSIQFIDGQFLFPGIKIDQQISAENGVIVVSGAQGLWVEQIGARECYCLFEFFADSSSQSTRNASLSPATSITISRSSSNSTRYW